MSPNRTTLSESNHKDFRGEVRLRDPATSREFSFPCEIDTGNPVAVALPENLGHNFTNQLTTTVLGGAGTGTLSSCWEAEVVSLETLQIDHPTMVVTGLPSGKNYGLIGLDLLRYLDVSIYDQPKDKKMALLDAHI